MNKILLTLFLSITVLGFIDSDDDPSKSYLIVDKDGKVIKIMIDKRELKLYNVINLKTRLHEIYEKENLW